MNTNTQSRRSATTSGGEVKGCAEDVPHLGKLTLYGVGRRLYAQPMSELPKVLERVSQFRPDAPFHLFPDDRGEGHHHLALFPSPEE